MKKASKDAYELAKHIHNWLHVHTPSIRSSSPHTIRTYSTTLSLFVGFLEGKKKINPCSLSTGCFSRDYIEEWIMWLKEERCCSPETCNIRLTALRTFLKYLAARDVSCLSLYQSATLIPRQKIARKKVTGMSKDAVKALMSAPDVLTKTGQRDLVLLIILYCTAAKIDEILSMKISQLHLETDKPYISVIGKGRKIRTLYILPKGVAHLKKYIEEFHSTNPSLNAYVFYSRNKGIFGKMTPESVNKQLKKYAVTAHGICKDVPLNLHAHQIRHAKASHWLEDGMNIVQISFLLGHANLHTTMIYLDITTEQESKALATLEDENQRNTPKRWKSGSDSLTAFLGVKGITERKI
ncbi:integrase/recombinase XerD [Dysgonomonas sp. PH5-45]|uniref:tyrosine-type recombinase/integrase n=1 Tax=unclassified Dysgonomonas TaxID=2630389 RepID=UPI00247329E7|nr:MULTISPECIES: tyrosine-type recombinase/integrase [unclassified Dysgonomonas]MDH6356088.1 integrase/recombinase XerD [Dysgonomonas sp. PH5-45]MDH6388982.1 integrase/recombinase XerD [Dysgonomonas sp. PH5-37]